MWRGLHSSRRTRRLAAYRQLSSSLSAMVELWCSRSAALAETTSAIARDFVVVCAADSIMLSNLIGYSPKKDLDTIIDEVFDYYRRAEAVSEPPPSPLASESGQ